MKQLFVLIIALFFAFSAHAQSSKVDLSKFKKPLTTITPRKGVPKGGNNAKPQQPPKSGTKKQPRETAQQRQARLAREADERFMQSEFPSQGMRDLYMGAKKGDDYAQFQLGYCYMYGYGFNDNGETIEFKTDYDKAAEWLKKATNKDNPRAMVCLAILYQEGAGVGKNPTMAAGLLQKVVDMQLNDREVVSAAQYTLGLYYLDGFGVEENRSKGLDLLAKAANNGYVDAMLVLGEQCEKVGYKLLALKWYKAAMNNGNNEAKEKFIALKSELKPNIKTITTKGIAFNMVEVEGCDKVGTFFIGETEVTQELWKAVMGDIPSGDYNPSYPVVDMSWKDIQKFLKKLRELTKLPFNLPNQNQWSFAERGGNWSLDCRYSGSDDRSDVAYDDPYLHPVRQKEPNELHIYDMTGSVGEWCSDDYNYESGNRVYGLGKGKFRLVNWGDVRHDKSDYKPGDHAKNLGLRLVLEGVHL